MNQQNRNLERAGRSRFASWRLLGLGFWQAWQMVAMCTNVVVPNPSAYPVLGNALLWLLVFMTVGYLLVAVLARQVSPLIARTPCLVVAGGLTAFGTACMPVAMYFGEGTFGLVLYLTAAVAAAGGNALLLIMWGELWSALATGRVGQHLYVSYTFAFALYFITLALPTAVATAFTAMFPVIGAMVLASCKNEPRRKTSVLPLDMKSVPVVRILVCILVISVVYGTSQGLVNTFGEGDVAFMPKTMLLAGGAIFAVTLSMALIQPGTEPIALYQPVIPAMVAGLALLMILPLSLRFIGGGLIIMGVYCLDMFMMLVSTDIAFRSRVPVALSFGAVILSARIGTLIGSITADVMLESAYWSTTLRSNTFLLGIIVLTLIGMLLFTQTDVQRICSTPRVRKSDKSVEHKCKAVADMCALTNRESEVLVLLARGRSVPYICDELSIAQGTAKHHVSNIYRKVGVYDRQGLLDIIEQGGAGKSVWE